MFVENEKQLQKFLQVREKLPNVIAFVQWGGVVPKAEGVYSWLQFLELGGDVLDALVEERMKAQIPERCVQLIYTSGTTGRPSKFEKNWR